MKTRVLLIALVLTLVACVQFLANCSSPLESYPNPNPPGPLFDVDTITVTDTLLLSDSVMVMDTLLQVDTLILVDTVLQSDTILRVDTVVVKETVFETDTLVVVDTVTVYVSDSCGMAPLCATLKCWNKKIVWHLANRAGRYRLDFIGSTEKGKPAQPLVVDVEGTLHNWIPEENEELSFEADLSFDATVVITPENPKAFGHSIRICLTLSRI